ncbi:hypothetical protein B9Z55_028926 [Caenorhabditis nigoni]|uniref:Uncharacterized protein n=1 Tax=Caenorhabditis nigoni TaxID=1611254 RepID=A0A2G5S9S9_9PELO|nr:hypothetical protein B9Z55_028926 [Caenorhabditis nigoni]
MEETAAATVVCVHYCCRAGRLCDGGDGYRDSGLKGSIGHAFAVCTRTESQDQASFCPFALREVSVLSELALGHLRYDLIDVPPQSNSPLDTVFEESHGAIKWLRLMLRKKAVKPILF